MDIKGIITIVVIIVIIEVDLKGEVSDEIQQEVHRDLIIGEKIRWIRMGTLCLAISADLCSTLLKIAQRTGKETMGGTGVEIEIPETVK